MSNTTSNLVPFQKGDDPRRNLKGRPRRQESILACMKRILQTVGPDDICPQELMVRRVVEAATATPPNLAAVRLLVEHCEGSPRQHVDLEAAGQGRSEFLTADELRDKAAEIRAFREARAALEAGGEQPKASP